MLSSWHTFTPDVWLLGQDSNIRFFLSFVTSVQAFFAITDLASTPSSFKGGSGLDIKRMGLILGFEGLGWARLAGKLGG